MYVYEENSLEAISLPWGTWHMPWDKKKTAQEDPSVLTTPEMPLLNLPAPTPIANEGPPKAGMPMMMKVGIGVAVTTVLLSAVFLYRRTL